MQKLILPGVLYLLTLVFGFGLSRVGKPYHSLLFNIHKLIALGAVILAAIRFWQIPRPGNSFALIGGLLVVAALCVIALFASGALMSAEKLDYAFFQGSLVFILRPPLCRCVWQRRQSSSR